MEMSQTQIWVNISCQVLLSKIFEYRVNSKYLSNWRLLFLKDIYVWGNIYHSFIKDRFHIRGKRYRKEISIILLFKFREKEA